MNVPLFSSIDKQVKFCEAIAEGYELEDAAKRAGISHEDAVQYYDAEESIELIFALKKITINRLQNELILTRRESAELALACVNDDVIPLSLRYNAINILRDFANCAFHCITLQEEVASYEGYEII